MDKQELAKGIFRYTFEPQPNRHFGTSVTAILSGNKAVLIDTAYEFQASELLADLVENGIAIDRIITAHFHNDHMKDVILSESVVSR